MVVMVVVVDDGGMAAWLGLGAVIIAASVTLALAVALQDIFVIIIIHK